MKKYFEKKFQTQSTKFWQIETEGSGFTITTGIKGTPGKSSSKNFESEEKCLKEAEKVIKRKIKGGYVEFDAPKKIRPEDMSNDEKGKRNKKAIADLYRNIQNTDVSSGQLSRIQNYIKEDNIIYKYRFSEVQDILHVLGYVAGLKDDYPKDITKKLDGFDFMKIFNPLNKWSQTDVRLLTVLSDMKTWKKQKKNFYRRFRDEILNKPDKNIYSLLLEKLIDAGFDEKKVLKQSLKFNSPALVSKSGIISSFGRYVLNEKTSEVISLSKKLGRLNQVVRLFLTGTPGKFDENAEIIIEDAKSDGDSGIVYLLGTLLEAKKEPFLTDVIALTKNFKDPFYKFSTAFYLMKYVPEQYRDYAFKLGKEVSMEVLGKDEDNIISLAFFADGFDSFKLRIADWMLKNFGKESKEFVAKYKEKNDAVRLKYYILLIDYLGEDSLDLLVRGLLYRTDKNYKRDVKTMISMISLYDHSAYNDKIEKSYAKVKDPQIKKIIANAIKPKKASKKSSKVKKDFPEKRWLFDELATGIVKSLAEEIKEKKKAFTSPVQTITAFMDEEGILDMISWGIDKIEFTLENGKTLKFAIYDQLYDAGVLDAFIKKYNYDYDTFNWGDTFRLPFSSMNSWE